MTASAPPELPFWERPEIVQQFAARDPDHRLVRLCSEFAHPPATRVLDLGCAGGRNAVYLAKAGFDVHARDSSSAMVAETRRRLAEVVGEREANSRARQGGMDELDDIADTSVDIVVALGVYQSAASSAEWERTLSACARVLARGGRVLVANFTNAFDPQGTGLTRVSGETHVYEGVGEGRGFLVDADTLDREFARHGIAPWIPTVTVSRELENGGRRVTANALYIKP